MAEAGPPPSTVLCRYFVHGVCREGANCRFSHDRNTAPSLVCTYYLKGSCGYGDTCRYDHVKAGQNSKQPTKQKSTILPKHDTTQSKHKNSKKASPPVLTKDENLPNKMVTLRKHTLSECSTGSLTDDVLDHVSCSPSGKPIEEWVKAKEFIPGQPYHVPTVPASYAEVVHNEDSDTTRSPELPPPEGSKELLCPFIAQGSCPYEEKCTYLHGDMCEYCCLPVLHPGNPEQREQHLKECVAEHEKDMEISFAIAKSKDKACGICMDIVMEKENPNERRFGVLSDCNHVFCLPCIRKWRSAKQFENKIVRACPECRVKSDFVTPSQYWVETREEKDVLIEGYKNALSNKPCRYFDQGRGECPFYDKCFYLHANPDGSKAVLPPRQPRRRLNADGDVDLVGRILLWDFFEDRNDRSLLSALETELNNMVIDLAGIFDFSSDDSDDEFL